MFLNPSLMSAIHCVTLDSRDGPIGIDHGLERLANSAPHLLLLHFPQTLCVVRGVLSEEGEKGETEGVGSQF